MSNEAKCLTKAKENHFSNSSGEFNPIHVTGSRVVTSKFDLWEYFLIINKLWYKVTWYITFT